MHESAGFDCNFYALCLKYMHPRQEIETQKTNVQWLCYLLCDDGGEQMFSAGAGQLQLLSKLQTYKFETTEQPNR